MTQILSHFINIVLKSQECQAEVYKDLNGMPPNEIILYSKKYDELKTSWCVVTHMAYKLLVSAKIGSSIELWALGLPYCRMIRAGLLLFDICRWSIYFLFYSFHFTVAQLLYLLLPLYHSVYIFTSISITHSQSFLLHLTESESYLYLSMLSLYLLYFLQLYHLILLQVCVTYSYFYHT